MWAYLQCAWQTTFPDWELIEGTCPPGPWVKSLAIQDGLTRARGKVLVLADADVWTDGVGEAVCAMGSHQWAVPHTMVYRLTEAATVGAMRGEQIDPRDVEQNPYKGVMGGGMTVIRRSLYEEAPLDPRFEGWGQEDISVALAWRLLGGKPWRGLEPMWHFWHPPMPRKNRSVGSDENAALYRRYREAAYNPAQMRQIIAEFKGVET